MLSVARDHRPRELHPTRVARDGAHARLATRAAILVVAGFTLTLMFARVDMSAPVMAASDPSAQVPANVALAQAFTAALNAHDIDAIVDMFSEEGPGATVHADRYAWTRFEIRLWAQHQISENIAVAVDEYWATDSGAAWNADVYRADMRALGISALPVFNTIFVQDGKVMDFTSTLANPSDAERLQHLWRPGSVPDYPTR